MSQVTASHSGVLIQALAVPLPVQIPITVYSSSTWVPITHTGDPEGVFGSRLQPRPPLVTVGIWKVKERIEKCVSPFLSLSNIVPSSTGKSKRLAPLIQLKTPNTSYQKVETTQMADCMKHYTIVIWKYGGK